MPTKQLAVTTTPQTLVDVNDKRTALAVHNSSATAIAYVSDNSSVSTNDGFHIQPKTSLMISEIEGVDITTKWLIVGDGTLTASVLEGFFKPKGNGNGNGVDVQDGGAYDPPA